MTTASNTAASNKYMTISVEAYSGQRADERPIRFVLGERRYEVIELIDKWYSPSETWFKVRADDGYIYILRHATGVEETWNLVSFKSDRQAPQRAQ